MNLLHSPAIISSSNERKMPAALSPSQIHILFGDGEAEKKPIRTRWQLFLPQMREKCPIPCPHPRSTLNSRWRGLEETIYDSLAVISSPNERKMPDTLSPSRIHILFGDGETEKKPVIGGVNSYMKNLLPA